MKYVFHKSTHQLHNTLLGKRIILVVLPSHVFLKMFDFIIIFDMNNEIRAAVIYILWLENPVLLNDVILVFTEWGIYFSSLSTEIF